MTNETMNQEMQEVTVSNAPEKKSVLLAKQKELVERNDKLLKEMQEREYQISFADKKVYNRLVKFLEKDAQWGHTTAAGLIMLYNNLRQNQSVVKAENWDGNVTLRAANVGILWQMLMKMTGKGFFEARDFVELMAHIGESISKAYEKVNEDNFELRESHTELAKLDQLIDDGQYEDDTTSSIEDCNVADCECETECEAPQKEAE